MLPEMPTAVCGHQMIYIPPTFYYPKGQVYVFGGLEDENTFQPANLSLDLDKLTWERWDDLNPR